MAINAQILTEMEIPESYIEALPKVRRKPSHCLVYIFIIYPFCFFIQNGRASLGDSTYKIITEDFFDPDYLLSTLDLSSEHKIVDFKNKIEASVVIWKRKMTAKDSKSSWGSGVSAEKRELLEDRAETVLLILKHRFPGLPQSDLDISKIEYNKVRPLYQDFKKLIFLMLLLLLLLQDIGHAILESYSRILETLAFTVLSRIEDVMNADALARNPSCAVQKKFSVRERSGSERFSNFKDENDESQTPTSKTLLDFMGWNLEQGDTDGRKDPNDDAEPKQLSKTENINKKLSYIERLEILGGSRSPTARH